MNRIVLLASIVAIAFGCVVSATDYCAIGDQLCGGAPHIACDNDGEFAWNCQDPQLITFSAAQNAKIVQLHNVNRNKVASGTVNNLKRASRMATMVHDQELADLAALNVKQCEMSHDQCHDTRMMHTLLIERQQASINN